MGSKDETRRGGGQRGERRGRERRGWVEDAWEPKLATDGFRLAKFIRVERKYNFSLKDD